MAWGAFFDVDVMLTTNRMILRRALADDLEDFNAFMSDSRAMAYWSTPPHPDLATSAEQLDRMAASPDPLLYFVFEYQGRVIGMGGVHNGNEVGFMLHPDYWRQGFVTEAMDAILSHTWASTAFDHVHADADPRNDASVGLLKSLGFFETGRAARTYCVGGVWSDSVYFRLNRPS